MPKPAARRALTEKGIAALKPEPGKRVTVFDTIVPGLCVRVTERGVKSFTVIARHQGRQRWVTIGTVGAIGLADAREAAREALAKARRGEDPGAKPAPIREADTFAKVAAFVEKYAKRHNRSWAETERIFAVYVTPAWGKRDVRSITRRDVIELLETVARENGPIMSNRVLAAARKLFSWCVERDIVTANPCSHVTPLGKEVSRDRVLSDDELRVFWAAAGTLGEPWRSFFSTLALTGQRLGEVAGMRWPDVDLDRATWTLPREATKSDRAHEVPLSPEVVAILTALSRRSGPYVFTTGDGRKPVRGFSAAKRVLDAAMPGVAPWRLHDLRRTFATGAARSGIAPHVVEKALNHAGGVIAGVAAVYNRYGFETEKRRALEAWSAHVLGLIAERPGNVVGLRARAGE